MRGTPLDFPLDSLTLGIIPAYAGNTIIGKYFVEDNGDHPRVCGEHIKRKIAGDFRLGSSPRMRGTP